MENDLGKILIDLGVRPDIDIKEDQSLANGEYCNFRNSATRKGINKTKSL